jgi:hypothetical protein
VRPLVTRNETEVFDALCTRFTPGFTGDADLAGAEWAMIPQVQTGSASKRYIDCLMLGLWASRGLELWGVEIKCARSDWLRELKDPAKAETGFFPFSDRWWIATGSAGLVKPEELPAGWGLIEPSGETMRIKVQAKKRPDPQPLTRLQIALLARRAQETRLPLAHLRKAWARGRKRGEEDAKKMLGRRMEEVTERLKLAREKVAEFEKSSGLSIFAEFEWETPNHVGGKRYGTLRELGEAVRASLLAPGGAASANAMIEAKNILDRIRAQSEVGMRVIDHLLGVQGPGIPGTTDPRLPPPGEEPSEDPPDPPPSGGEKPTP